MTGPDHPSVSVRSLEELEEFEAAVAFQEAIWGTGFSERVPRSLMKVTRRLGGVVAGAFDATGRMVGFVYGMTGPETPPPTGRPGGGGPGPGPVVHWSDILAVAPEWRNRGVGRRLKLFQRERLRDMGVTRMYWTYDPLESRNAWLNLSRLGAEAVEYVPDMYGRSDSPLHRGLGTDRFVVRWALDAPAPGPAGEEVPPGLPRAFAVDTAGPDPRPVEGGGGASPGSGAPAGAGSPSGPVLVPIPADIQGLRDRDPELAGRWRAATRKVLLPRLRQGWRIRRVVREPVLSLYVLEPPADAPPGIKG